MGKIVDCDPMKMGSTKEATLSADQLRQILNYCKDTGKFTWKVRRGGQIAGSIAGTTVKSGHIGICINGRPWAAHRLAWLWVTGDWPKQVIDHIDGDPANNSFGNLRDVTRAMNSQNMRVATRASKLGVLGVHFCAREKRFSACIRVGGVKRHLGYFSTPEAASAAYVNAKRELHDGCTI